MSRSSKREREKWTTNLAWFWLRAGDKGTVVIHEGKDFQIAGRFYGVTDTEAGRVLNMEFGTMPTEQIIIQNIQFEE